MPDPTPNPYAREIFHGKLLDVATIAALRQAEEDLGYELTVVQGVGGAEASGGTHLGLDGEGGRAVDLAPYDHDRKVRVLKQIGFAVWFRPDIPGLWGAHIHAVLILNSIDNDRGIAPAAFRQIDSFRRGRDGLKGDQPDPEPFRVTPQPVFHFPPKTKPQPPARTKVSRARNRLAEAQAALEQAAALLDDTNPDRVHAREHRDDIRRLARRAEFILDQLPAR